jgi:glycine hydroxymethyltransferase
MLVDLRNKGVTGRAAEEILDGVGVTVNKNAIPFDPQPPVITSGIRVGTPAVTTRGLDENDMRTVAEIIDLALSYGTDKTKLEKAKNLSAHLCSRYPIY